MSILFLFLVMESCSFTSNTRKGKSMDDSCFYKITFYSQRGINVFSFNNGNGIIYDDLDNNTYYYLNADNGSVVINKFF